MRQLVAYWSLTLDTEDLLDWYKQKEWFLWAMTAAQVSENHGDKWGFTLYLQWEIYTSKMMHLFESKFTPCLLMLCVCDYLKTLN